MISKFSASKNDTCKGTEKKDKKDVTKKKQKHSKKTNFEDKSEKEVKRKDYSSWSKKETPRRGNSTSNSGEKKKNLTLLEFQSSASLQKLTVYSVTIKLRSLMRVTN